MKKINAGFTLIEILIVVLIIAILTSISIPQYQIAANKSRAAEALTALSTITEAQESYYKTKGQYATNLQDLAIGVPQNRFYTFYCNSTCYAMPSQRNLPVLEFHLQKKTTAAADNYIGKRWCQVNDVHPHSPVALAICKSFGPQDTTMNDKYYIIY